MSPRKGKPQRIKKTSAVLEFNHAMIYTRDAARAARQFHNLPAHA
jgi:hypothetical protein